MTRPLLVFDSFEPGRAIGRARCRVDAPLLALWRRIYGEASATSPELPAGLATIVLMRSYMEVMSPRPPGNIQAGKRMTFLSSPRLDEEIETEFVCTRKELRKERRYLDVRARGTGDGGRPIYDVEMTMIWAR